MIIAVISSSVSILEEDEAVDDMVECTELSVELRSERRESRMVLARKKSISAALDVAVGVGVLFPLDLLAGEMGAASSSGGDTSCVLHNRWPPPPPTPAPPPPPPASDRLRSGCCCEVCNRLRMVRARRKASWLSFSSAASGEERRALQPPSFFGERRLNEVKKGISTQIWECIVECLPGEVLEGAVAACWRNALVVVILVHCQHGLVQHEIRAAASS